MSVRTERTERATDRWVPTLAERMTALARAAEAGADRLEPELLDEARAVLHRGQDRVRLGDETVVALAGATGSGKSSLFNALAGAEIAAPGVRRPTTTQVLALAHQDADLILDWLEVPRRQRGGVPGGPPELVLLDLPDLDSVVSAHALTAGRVVDRADLLVWVLDPQKYADRVVHERFLRPLSGHGAVIVLVLNQIDRLTPAEASACLADLRRLAQEDGLWGATVLGASTRTGQGVDELRALLVEAARRREAATARLVADIRSVAARIERACGPAVPVRGTREELVDALGDAAGVPTVVAAVRSATLRHARARTGWPPTRLFARLRPDPMRRLHLGSGTDRTSVPGPTATEQAQTRLAVRRFADAELARMPTGWAMSVPEPAAGPELAGALDHAVAGAAAGAVPVDSPRWWRAVGALQWALLAVAAAGAVWLLVVALLGYLQLPEPTLPRVGAVPVPTLLLAGGVGAGLVLAGLARALAGVGARRRARRALVRLQAAVAQVAEDHVSAPLAHELARLERCRAAAVIAAAPDAFVPGERR
ncbi:MAG: GTPase [Cellulomonadaceae bacterium]